VRSCSSKRFSSSVIGRFFRERSRVTRAGASLAIRSYLCRQIINICHICNKFLNIMKLNFASFVVQLAFYIFFVQLYTASKPMIMYKRMPL
jgi:hypothetical protein